MEIIVLFLTLLSIIVSVSAVPLSQFLIRKKRAPKEQTIFTFDKSLYEYDTDNIRFENADLFQKRKNNRVLINARGNVRQPNGNVIDAKSFEQLKSEVKKIELP